MTWTQIDGPYCKRQELKPLLKATTCMVTVFEWSQYIKDCWITIVHESLELAKGLVYSLVPREYVIFLQELPEWCCVMRYMWNKGSHEFHHAREATELLDVCGGASLLSHVP